MEYIKKVEPRAFAITKEPFGVKVKIDKDIYYYKVTSKDEAILITIEIKKA